MPIVPIGFRRQHNFGRGKGQYLHHASEEEKEKEIAAMLKTPDGIRDLQKKLYQKAKQEKTFRFYALSDKVYRADIMEHAYRLVKAKKGAPGIDGVSFEAIEGMEGGAARYCAQIAEELRSISIKTSACTRYRQRLRGRKRKPVEEDDWKAVFGKTERTV